MGEECGSKTKEECERKVGARLRRITRGRWGRNKKKECGSKVGGGMWEENWEGRIWEEGEGRNAVVHFLHCNYQVLSRSRRGAKLHSKVFTLISCLKLLTLLAFEFFRGVI